MYQKAIELLTNKENFYINVGLDRIKSVLEVFGNPQNDLKCIHVAGTNGKGSVCAMLESVLRCAGYKTGLYTSPHIYEYTERIKLNGKNISRDDFANLIFEVKNKADEIQVHLTEFEILTVCMFLYFKRKNVEICIIETGLGGRLDATNVIPTNLCSIITQIDLEHTDILGNTKEQIAFEKAGIIKPGCPVITSMGYEVIRDKADKEDSMFIMVSPFVNPEYADALSLKGVHQVENAALVVTALEFLFDIDKDIIIKGLKQVEHPCRFEYIKEKNIILDGSHNPNGIEVLRKNLDYYFRDKERRFIFGALKTKDYEKMMKILFREEDEVYLYGFAYPKAATFEELRQKCPVKAKNYNEIRESDLFDMDEKLTIICGSFYMLGQMKI